MSASAPPAAPPIGHDPDRASHLFWDRITGSAVLVVVYAAAVLAGHWLI